MENYNAPVFHAVPPLVVALAVLILGLELMFQGAEAGMFGGAEGIGWRINAMQDYALIDSVWNWMVQNRTFPPEHLLRFLSYPLIHGNLVHAGFVAVFVLALGKLVSEVLSPVVFITVFWVSAILGGLVYVALLNTNVPLVGGYPGVYGLVGSYTLIMWMKAVVEGTNRWRAFTLIGALFIFQVVFGGLVGSLHLLVAEGTGFVVGFALTIAMVPGVARRMMAMLRSR